MVQKKEEFKQACYALLFGFVLKKKEVLLSLF